MYENSIRARILRNLAERCGELGATTDVSAHSLKHATGTQGTQALRLVKVAMKSLEAEGLVRIQGAVHTFRSTQYGVVMLTKDGERMLETWEQREEENTRLPAGECPVVFISYCHEDEELATEGETHLKVLEREGRAQIWKDTKIQPGARLVPAIEQALGRAQVYLYFVSKDFIMSEWCWEQEWEAGEKAVKERGAVMIPVIIQTCSWEGTKIGNRLALPKDGRPVRAYNDPNVAWKEVVEKVRQLLAGRSEVRSIAEKRIHAAGEGCQRWDAVAGHGKQWEIIRAVHVSWCRYRHYERTAKKEKYLAITSYGPEQKMEENGGQPGDQASLVLMTTLRNGKEIGLELLLVVHHLDKMEATNYVVETDFWTINMGDVWSKEERGIRRIQGGHTPGGDTVYVLEEAQIGEGLGTNLEEEWRRRINAQEHQGILRWLANYNPERQFEHPQLQMSLPDATDSRFANKRTWRFDLTNLGKATDWATRRVTE